jgi:hypothetical protein
VVVGTPFISGRRKNVLKYITGSHSFIHVRGDSFLIANGHSQWPFPIYKRYSSNVYKVNMLNLFQNFIYVFIHRFHGRQPSLFPRAAHAHSAVWAKCIFKQCISLHSSAFCPPGTSECACAALRNKDGGRP